MLNDMRQLALIRLWLDLDAGRSPNPEAWYRELRERDLGPLLPFLVEGVAAESKGKEKSRYYTLSPDPNDNKVAVLEVQELKQGDAERLPFIAQTGNTTPIGPIIKRSIKDKKIHLISPEPSIQKRMLEQFAERAQARSEWGRYFEAAHDCWTRKTLRFNGQESESPRGSLHMAVERLDEQRTVLVAFRTVDGELPGEVSGYKAYLEEVLAVRKYTTKKVGGIPDQRCALCDRGPVIVYSNALPGAGINLTNIDRPGAYSGLDVQSAWKYFALCVGCADLLFVYWNHVGKRDFRTRVAGETALVIPTLNVSLSLQRQFLKRVKHWARTAASNTAQDQVLVKERQLLTLLGEEKAVNTVTILWAELRQTIDDVRGVVTDILPSRLSELTKSNLIIESTASRLFPEVPLEEFRYDVGLNILRKLFDKPHRNHKKARALNRSKRLSDLRRDIVEALYHNKCMPRERFAADIHDTAQRHWEYTLASDRPVYRLLYEGWSPKTKKGFLTTAGWVLQLARFLHYLRMMGVDMSDSEPIYQPQSEPLKAYFGPESGIRGPAKAFAFILGVLYGDLLRVQAAKKVNVMANAMKWLKRLTLAGNDLPELYVKVREKLMIYERDGNAIVRELIAELGELGTRLGTDIKLDETQACYFLLLGQSLAVKMIPKQTDKENDDA